MASQQIVRPAVLVCVLATLLLAGPVPVYAAQAPAPIAGQHDQLRPSTAQKDANRITGAVAPAAAVAPTVPLQPRAVVTPQMSPNVVAPLREVFGYAYMNSALTNTTFGYTTWNFHLLSTLALFGFHVNSDGTLSSTDTSFWQGSTVTAVINAAHSAGTRVVPVVVLTSGVCSALINRSTTVAQVVPLLQGRADGLSVDYEDSNQVCSNGQTIRSMLTDFVRQLRAAIGSAYLTIATYGSSAEDSVGMFDIPTLAGYVDAFMVMAYDMDGSNWSHAPLYCASYCLGPNSPIGGYYWNDTRVTGDYLKVVPASKVILGIPYYGQGGCVGSTAPNQSPTSGTYFVDTYLDMSTIPTHSDVSNFVGNRDANDPAGQDPWDTWSDATARCTREMYWDDVTSLGLKYDLVNHLNLRGVGLWTLGYGGGASELWSSLANHFALIPGAPTAVAACAGDGFAWVTWSPASPNGSVVTSYTVHASPGGASVTVPANAGFAVVPGLSDATTYTFTVAATNSYGDGVGSAPSNGVTPAPPPGSWPGGYVPLPPSRILDTRNGTGGVSAPIAGGQWINVPVLGHGGVPASGVSGVVVNLTAADATASTFLVTGPAGACLPYTSNLNVKPGGVVAALAPVALGNNGAIWIFNKFGTVDVVADVEGYFTDAASAPAASGRFQPLVPARLLDTRTGNGAPAAPLGPGATLTLQVTGRGGVPASGVSAIALNLTSANATVPTYLTVYPAGGARPLASNLNLVPGQVIANRVVVPVNSQGQVAIYNQAGSVTVVADVGGWFTDASDTTATGGRYTALTPVRIADTRTGMGGRLGPLGPGQTMTLNVTSQPGMPASTIPTAVIVNLTIADATAPTYLTVYPTGAARPLASDINSGVGDVRANLVIVKVGSNGSVDIFNYSGTATVVVDIVGWYQ